MIDESLKTRLELAVFIPSSNQQWRTEIIQVSVRPFFIYQNAIHKQFQICTPKADDDIVPIGGLDHSGWDSDSQNTILKIRIELSFAYRQQCGPPALARAALLENHLGAIIMIPFPDGDESES